MSNKTLIEWNTDVGTRFLTIHPDGSFDIDKDAPPLFVIGELAKAFIRQQDRIKRLEDIINRAHLAFFSDSSDRKVSIAMHRILDEEVRKEAKP